MLVLIDSNILTFIANPSSPLYQESTDATLRLQQRGDVPCIVPQNLYEFWAVATRPLTARGLEMTTIQAQIELERLKTLFQTLPDSPAIYAEWERLVVQHSVSGKNSHDARIAAAMIAHGVTHLLTFNGADFKRFAGITAIEPQDV